MGIVGDFLLISRYGVWVRVFTSRVSGLRVAQSNGLGLRVFWDSGLDHLMVM